MSDRTGTQVDDRIGVSGSLDPDDQATARKVRDGFRRRLLLGVSIMAIALAVGAILGRTQWLGMPSARPDLRLEIIGVALEASGVVLELALLVYLVRTGRFRRTRTSALWALTRAQRLSLKAQVKRNVIEPGTDPEVVHLMAVRLADQVWTEWMMVGLTAVAGGQALVHRAMLPIAGFVIVGACVWILVVSREIKAASRFMLDHSS